MNEYRAFMRAIQAAPEDDLPRLVFADWLDERGDPRGEFIRVQVFLARFKDSGLSRKARNEGLAELFDQLKNQGALSDNNTDKLTSKMIKDGRYTREQEQVILQKSYKRERKLLTTYGGEWQQWHDEIDDNGYIYISGRANIQKFFTRGFLSAELKPSQVRSINLFAAKITSLFSMPDYPQLKKLSLSSNRITSLSGMSDLPQLEELRMDGSPLSTLSSMPNLPRLHTFIVQGNNIASLSGMPDLPELIHLNLSQSKLKSLVGMPKLQHLKRLYLARNELPSLSGLPDLPQLEELNIIYSPLPQQEIEKLARGEYGCQNLRELYINEEYVEAFLAVREAYGTFPNLQQINEANVFRPPPDAGGGEERQIQREMTAEPNNGDTAHAFASPEVHLPIIISNTQGQRIKSIST